ncbi:membrane-bound lytic murein transglycosylase A [Loktanella ponticola]|uniref:peptidoglycan lytic exotransglycosylase n=2 Tax=Yoonia ponticola TaxID=1524255 RepID=A0A7W9BJN0_9RHOB|nr:membrane-bound lytic murein transglycosylase A [Yoonia ponticola]
MPAGAVLAEPTYTMLGFDDLNGWAADDHQAALSTFLNTCGDINDPEWANLCALAADATDARAFFELFFQPVLIEDGEPMLFTGYFEPELRGSLTQSEEYQHPIHAVPDDLIVGQPYATRRELQEGDLLAGRGLEIAWLADPVDLFFLQVQGSGRVKLPDGNSIRVGYGGKNGREYSSVGLELVNRGTFESHQVSADVIRNWVNENPDEGRELLWVNDSYVFFREVSEVPADLGPLGAMNRSITTMRSIAVDPSITKLGAPVWIEKEGADPLNRLMIAQDTGSAIKGAQRADIFFGTGDQAGLDAGRIKDAGRIVVLLPIQRAFAKLPPELIE